MAAESPLGRPVTRAQSRGPEHRRPGQRRRRRAVAEASRRPAAGSPGILTSPRACPSPVRHAEPPARLRGRTAGAARCRRGCRPGTAAEAVSPLPPTSRRVSASLEPARRGPRRWWDDSGAARGLSLQFASAAANGPSLCRVDRRAALTRRASRRGHEATPSQERVPGAPAGRSVFSARLRG